MGSQSQTRLINYTLALVRECSPRACSPSPSEHLQRNPPTGRCAQPLLPSPTQPPRGQRCSSPLRPQQRPCDAECASLVSPEATQKQQPLVPVKQSSPGGDVAFVQHPSPLPQRPPCVGARPRHWAGFSSRVLPAPQATGRCAPLPERPERQRSVLPAGAHLGLEMRRYSRSHGSRPEVSGAQAVTPQRVDWISGLSLRLC